MCVNQSKIKEESVTIRTKKLLFKLNPQYVSIFFHGYRNKTEKIKAIEVLPLEVSCIFVFL